MREMSADGPYRRAVGCLHDEVGQESSGEEKEDEADFHLLACLRRDQQVAQSGCILNKVNVRPFSSKC